MWYNSFDKWYKSFIIGLCPRLPDINLSNEVMQITSECFIPKMTPFQKNNAIFSIQWVLYIELTHVMTWDQAFLSYSQYLPNLRHREKK